MKMQQRVFGARLRVKAMLLFLGDREAEFDRD